MLQYLQEQRPKCHHLPRLERVGGDTSAGCYGRPRRRREPSAGRPTWSGWSGASNRRRSVSPATGHSWSGSGAPCRHLVTERRGRVRVCGQPSGSPPSFLATSQAWNYSPVVCKRDLLWTSSRQLWTTNLEEAHVASLSSRCRDRSLGSQARH